jgi:hypothetical protein
MPKSVLSVHPPVTRACRKLTQFLPIAPSRSVGNLLTGTLNFGAKKARKLLTLGYIDTLLFIEAYAKLDSFPQR